MKTIFALAATTALFAVAPMAHAAGQCFWVRTIDNLTVTDDEQTMYIRSGLHDIYRLDMPSRCAGLSYKTNVGIKSATGAGSICEPLDIDLIVRENGMRVPCPVTGLHKLTPAEVAALPKKLKP